MNREIFTRTVFGIGVLLLAAVIMASAQSRRVNTRPTPKPQPTPETIAPEPTPKPKPTPTPEIKPAVKFRVVSDIPLTVFQDFTRPENITLWIVSRLEKSPLVAIKSNVSGTQKKAREIAVAAAEDEHVVFIQFNLNSTFSGAGAQTNEGDVWIEYAVLSPQTGKSKFRDRVFVRRGSISQSRRACYPSIGYADYMLLNASFEVADRIMAKFNLPQPDEKCAGRAFNLLEIAAPTGFQTGIINESRDQSLALPAMNAD